MFTTHFHLLPLFHTSTLPGFHTSTVPHFHTSTLVSTSTLPHCQLLPPCKWKHTKRGHVDCGFLVVWKCGCGKCGCVWVSNCGTVEVWTYGSMDRWKRASVGRVQTWKYGSVGVSKCQSLRAGLGLASSWFGWIRVGFGLV